MGEESRQSLIPGLPEEVAVDCLIKIPHRHHSNLRSVSREWKQLVSSPSFYTHRKLAGAAESLVCLIQSLPTEKTEISAAGNSKHKSNSVCSPTYGLSLFNPLAGTWHRHPAGGAFPLFSQCVAVAGKLVVLGGWDPASLDSAADVHVIDVATGACRRGTSMSVARSFFACAAVGRLVYIAGGHDDQKNALRTAEVYDPETDRWLALPPMAEERDECHGVAIGGEFLVISGYDTDNQGRFGRGGERFNPATGVWAKEDDSLWGDGGELPVPDSPRSACFVLSSSSTSSTSSGEEERGEERLWHLECNVRRRGVREYDGKLKRWKAVSELPENLRSSLCVAVIDGGGNVGCGELLVMGSDEDHKHSAWVMDVRSKKWRKIDTRSVSPVSLIPPQLSIFE